MAQHLRTIRIILISRSISLNRGSFLSLRGSSSAAASVWDLFREQIRGTRVLANVPALNNRTFFAAGLLLSALIKERRRFTARKYAACINTRYPPASIGPEKMLRSFNREYPGLKVDPEFCRKCKSARLIGPRRAISPSLSLSLRKRKKMSRDKNVCRFIMRRGAVQCDLLRR